MPCNDLKDAPEALQPHRKGMHYSSKVSSSSHQGVSVNTELYCDAWDTAEAEDASACPATYST